MELEPYVAALRDELALAAEAAGDDAKAVAERLIVPLDSSVRLALLEALSAAVAHRSENSLNDVAQLTESVMPWLFNRDDKHD